MTYEPDEREIYVTGREALRMTGRSGTWLASVPPAYRMPVRGALALYRLADVLAAHASSRAAAA